MFATNDEWQMWRGAKQKLDYVLSYPEMVASIAEKLESNDPSLTFADEEDSGNSLER